MFLMADKAATVYLILSNIYRVNTKKATLLSNNDIF